MTKLIVTWIMFVILLDAFLFMGQLAVTEINPEGNVQIFNIDDSITAKNDAGNYTLDPDVLGKLPSGEDSVSPETGNIFTDIFASIKSWVADSTGISYIVDYINAFPNFLKSLGLPTRFVFIVGSVWHTVNVFLFVLLMWGRD